MSQDVKKDSFTSHQNVQDKNIFVHQLIENETKSRNEIRHNIDDGSGLETEHEQHYVEIVNDEHGRVTTRLVDGSVLSEADKSSIIQADQLVGFDFMNFRVVRCNDDGTTEEVIENEGETDVNDMMLQVNDGQTHYILQNPVSEESILPTNQEDASDNVENNQYVQVVEKDSVPLVFFKTDPQILSKAKNVEEKSETQYNVPVSKELAGSPNFRQYLYPCKQCDFKCNAIKELTVHKSESHPANGNRFRAKLTPPPPSKPITKNNLNFNFSQELRTRQCPICEYSTVSRNLLKRHLLKCHDIKKAQLEAQDEEYESGFKSYEYKTPSESGPLKTTIYHCATCGLSSNNSFYFKKHGCHSNIRKRRSSMNWKCWRNIQRGGLSTEKTSALKGLT
ncbi:uncharacterized protein LOC143919644 isoform X2 [Arctopsyche grandis]|uniref:uncharacterized protein LOC143919644 isoform X2 n=1 Tax=Arctopsyche grandis TaxID=121162 RepID=UPI00406D913B